MIADQQLKLALAKELPEMIYISVNDLNFSWRKTKTFITDYEWDWVVNQCIGNLKDFGNVEFNGGIYSSQQSLFVCLLLEIEDWPILGVDACGLTCLTNATWQQRAISYFKVMGKEIV